MRSDSIKLAQFLLGCLWASERIFSFKYDAIWFDTVLYCSDGKSLVSIGFVKRIDILSDTHKCRVCRILLCSLKFAIILRHCIKCCLRAVSTGEGIKFCMMLSCYLRFCNMRRVIPSPALTECWLMLSCHQVFCNVKCAFLRYGCMSTDEKIRWYTIRLNETQSSSAMYLLIGTHARCRVFAVC